MAMLTTERPPVAVLLCGYDRGLVERLRSSRIPVLHQVGTVDGARRALADGADGLILQGVEAGGHALATEPLAACCRSYEISRGASRCSLPVASSTPTTSVPSGTSGRTSRWPGPASA